MDKKQALRESAYKVFSKKGYKAAGISEIAKQANMAVGSFYNYYDGKEAIFLDVYIEENRRIRQIMIDNINWESEIAELVSQIFSWSRQLISANKILLEWHNPAISGELHSYYASKEGKAANTFHQFLVEKFTNRMLEEGYTETKIQEVLSLYQFFYYLDTHITEADFPNASQTIELLATYFVKGLMK